MWMMTLSAWLISLVGVAYFLAGSTRHRDADEADEALLDEALANLRESGRISGVYHSGKVPQTERAPHSDANVA
jgi:hypothetical protein